MKATSRPLGRVMLVLAALLAFVPGARAASDYPNRPVKILVGFAAGGATDLVARIVAEKLSARLNQQFVVENRAGAGGVLATGVVAKSPADGYTLLMASASHAINVSLQKSLPYDPIADFTPIVPVASTTNVLAVNPALPVNSVADYIALAKAKPGSINFSSAGVGSSAHLAGELFKSMAGIKITHVPYKGTGPALADVISGVITMNFSSLPPAVGQVKGGNLRALAVTGEKRIKSLPDVPTLKEQGIDVVVNGWHGLFAPGKTQDAILDKIAAATQAAMKDPKWDQALAKDGLEMPPERTRAQFAKFVADEHAFWGKKLKELKIEME